MDEINSQALRTRLSEVSKIISKNITDLMRHAKSQEDIENLRGRLANDLNERGLIHYKLVDFTHAFEDYSRSIEYSKDCGSCQKILAAAHFNRATVSYRMSRFDEALKDMEKAIALEPFNHEFQEGLRETKARVEEQRRMQYQQS